MADHIIIIKDSYKKNLLFIFKSVPIFIKIIGIGALVAFVFGSFTIYSINISLNYHLKKYLREDYQNKISILAETIEEPLKNKDYYAVRKIFDTSIKLNKKIYYIYLKEGDSYITGSYISDYYKNPKNRNIENSIVIERTYDSHKIKIFLGYSDDEFLSIIKDIEKPFFKILFLCVVIGLGLAYVLTHIIVKPIKELTNASLRVSEGNLDINLKVDSEDEIGILTNEFNNMVIKLKKYREIEDRRCRERGILLKRIVSAQEEEKKNISAELHDFFGPNLSAILLITEIMKKEIEKIKDEYNDEKQIENVLGNIFEVEKGIKDTINKLRDLSFTLRPSILDDYGLKYALKKYVETINKYSTINIDYQLIETEDSLKIKPEVETMLYRVVQEAVTNILRHSKAQNASIVLYLKRDVVTLIIEDDGIGFNVDEVLKVQENSIGILGMKERMELIGGDIKIESEIGEGTSIKINVPI